MNSGTELIVAGTETIVAPPPTAVGGGGGKMLGATDSITVATSERLKARKGNSPAPKELGRSRGCVWTLYDYMKHLDGLRQVASEATYAVWGYEICPETKRPHLQGYIHWETQKSLGKFSKQFGNCHVAIPRGTPRQNREYCLKIRPGDKPNDKFEEYGTLPVQGHRTDWEKAVNDIKNGVPVADVIEAQPQLIVAQRALKEFKQMLLKPKHREVNVIVVWGRGGTGKTRWAYEHYPDIFTKPPSKSSGSWWDGYSGQKEVLLDDYYGGIAYHEFLRVLDRYPYSAPICGAGYVWAQWDTIVITSNQHPRYWYKNKWGWPLRRRLNKIIKVSVIDGATSYEEEEFPADEEAWLAEEETYIEA